MRSSKLVLVCALAALFAGAGAIPALPASVRAAAGEAEVNGTAYATFEEALPHWTDGTLKLLSDADISSTAVLSGEAERTLDLAGFKLSVAKDAAVRVLSVTDGGKLTVKDSSSDGVGAITGGTVQGGNGGGIYAENATLCLESGTVGGNSAHRGGGIYAISSTLELKGGSVSSNTADYGGGIFAEDCTVTLSDTAQLTGNTASVSGGGLFLLGDKVQATASLTGGAVKTNSASLGGGVVLWKNTKLTLSGSAQISGNTASKGGGGLYVSGRADAEEGATAAKSVVEITGGTVEENVSEAGFGGGIKLTSRSTLKMTGGTVTKNSAGEGSGGLSLEYDAEAELGGQAVIMGNTLSAGGAETANNIFLAGGSCKVADDISENASLGFNRNGYGVISEGFKGDWAKAQSAVRADNEDYEVMLKDGDLVLGSNVPASISVVASKTRYSAGENFDKEGLTVTVTFRDGRSVPVTDYTVEGGTDLKAGTTSVTVVYTSRNVTLRSDVSIMVSGTGSGAATQPGGTSYWFLSVILLSAFFVIALIVVGIVTRGFKGKKKTK